MKWKSVDLMTLLCYKREWTHVDWSMYSYGNCIGAYTCCEADPRLQGSWGQHGAHLGPVGPRWTSCWPHEPCYQGTLKFQLFIQCSTIDKCYEILTSKRHVNNFEPVYQHLIALNIRVVEKEKVLLKTIMVDGKRSAHVIFSCLMAPNPCWPMRFYAIPLQWRHNGRDSVSNHQPHDWLLNRLFRRRSKKTSKLRVTGLCARNSPVSGEFPAQMASNAENVSIWWRHHVIWRQYYICWRGQSLKCVRKPYFQNRNHSSYVWFYQNVYLWIGHIFYLESSVLILYTI